MYFWVGVLVSDFNISEWGCGTSGYGFGYFWLGIWVFRGRDSGTYGQGSGYVWLWILVLLGRDLIVPGY